MSHVHSSRARDLIELILGYGLIVGIIWTPEHLQRMLSPIALVLTLLVVLARRQSRDELGLGWRGLIPSLWILPAAIGFAAGGTLQPIGIVENGRRQRIRRAAQGAPAPGDDEFDVAELRQSRRSRQFRKPSRHKAVGLDTYPSPANAAALRPLRLPDVQTMRQLLPACSSASSATARLVLGMGTPISRYSRDRTSMCPGSGR